MIREFPLSYSQTKQKHYQAENYEKLNQNLHSCIDLCKYKEK